MNDGAGRGGGRERQAGVMAAAATGIALLTAACGSGGGGLPAAATLTAYQKALAYAQCVRAHGVPGWPDPNSRGNFLINHISVGSARFTSANRACEHLDPATPLTPAQQRAAAAQALKFVACMRARGVPDFPDPIVNANGIVFHRPAGSSPNSQQFRSAQTACRKLLPGGGP